MAPSQYKILNLSWETHMHTLLWLEEVVGRTSRSSLLRHGLEKGVRTGWPGGPWPTPKYEKKFTPNLRNIGYIYYSFLS
jgi:hypothetical protein